MISIDLVTLCANTFIEYNKVKETRKLHIENIFVLNEAIKNECENNNIRYECNMDMNEFKKIRYSYNIFFDFYEDYDGYIIALANGIDIDSLINYYKQEKFYNEELIYILDKLDLENIFNEKSKQIKVRVQL